MQVSERHPRLADRDRVPGTHPSGAGEELGGRARVERDLAREPAVRVARVEHLEAEGARGVEALHALVDDRPARVQSGGRCVSGAGSQEWKDTHTASRELAYTGDSVS